MGSGWRKAIAESRDRLQSRALVGVVVPLLVLAVAFGWTIARSEGLAVRVLFFGSLGISLAFAVIVWGLRAGTQAAALVGAAICFLITFAGGLDAGGSLLHTGLPPLVALFVLTFAATRAGRVRKAQAGLAENQAERRKGRNAAQVIANLGTAGLVAAVGLFVPRDGALWAVPMLAALVEATADTVSSEIGQAFGGRPWLLTSLRRVDAGTDGAVSLGGTVAGVLAAGLVAMLGMKSLQLAPRLAEAAWLAGCAGLFFDSLLGATVERRGWLGNDLVNFASTVFAAVCSVGLTIAMARLRL